VFKIVIAWGCKHIIKFASRGDVMKRQNPRFIGCESIILAITIIAGSWLAPAYCQQTDVALLLQQTPTQGGIVTPSTGIYHFAPNSEVTLTAIPKPGYRFAYWLGDVSDPTTSSTVVHLNESKIIVAVFEPTESDILDVDKGLPASGGGGYSGGSGLFATAPNFGWPTATVSSGSGAKTQGPVYLYFKPDDGKTVIPEPATGVLLALGGLFAFIRRRTKSRHDKKL